MVKVTENLQNANKETFEVSNAEFEIVQTMYKVFETKDHLLWAFQDLALFYVDVVATNEHRSVLDKNPAHYGSSLYKIMDFLHQAHAIREEDAQL
jgi:hypothetical protein